LGTKLRLVQVWVVAWPEYGRWGGDARAAVGQ
jgi:hypothetical protein